jgi:O-antigen/teichoic acid export membrane protein
MFKKMILQVGIKFLAIACGIFATRWLNNNLTIQENADYAVIISYNATILMIVTLGLPTLTQKFYTNIEDKKILANFWATSVWIRMLSYIFSLVLIYFTYKIVGIKDLFVTIGIFSAQFILLSDNVYRSICDASNRSWQFSTTDLIGKILLITGLYGSIVFYKPSLWIFVVVSIFAYLISISLDAFWQKKSTTWGKFDMNIIKSELGAISFLSLSDIINGIYSKTDILFLKNTAVSNVELVSYSNGYKLFEIITIISSLTMPVLGSKLIKKMNIDKNSRTEFPKYYILVTLAGIIVGLGTILFSGLATWTIDPSGKFNQTQSVLNLLSIVIAILFPTMLSNDLLNLSGLEKKQFWSKVITGIVAIIGYLILIPIFGIWGAGYATIIFFAVECCTKGYFVWKYVK